MISLTPMDADSRFASDPFGEVEYLLRRADEETVAAIRATDRRVHESHAGMARVYSVKSLELMARLDGKAA